MSRIGETVSGFTAGNFYTHVNFLEMLGSPILCYTIRDENFATERPGSSMQSCKNVPVREIPGEPTARKCRSLYRPPKWPPPRPVSNKSFDDNNPNSGQRIQQITTFFARCYCDILRHSTVTDHNRNATTGKMFLNFRSHGQ